MLLNIFLLVSALCLDTFVASAAYGLNQVSLSRLQIAAINGICSLCLCLSLLFGALIDSLIPETFTKEICFFSLLILGCFKLLNASFRQYIRNHKSMHKNIRFSISQIRFIISIYTDPMKADADQNYCLSWREVIFFSIAMSIDSLIAGTMAAFLKIPVLLTALAAFLMGEFFTYLGLYIGRRISRCFPKDLSWASGILFIILAVLKR